MKAKKLMFALLGAVLLVSLIATPALANPAYGLIKANARKHIVRNWLFSDIGAWTQVGGHVTFACQSVEGFQYSVAVKGLTPGSVYTVEAVSLDEAWTPDGNLPTSDGEDVVYSLGSITTDGEGEGEVEGLIPLSPTHPFLPFGFYGWEIVVKDSNGSEVLRTAPSDPIDFQVFPAWP